jgi:hypothetical protein
VAKKDERAPLEQATEDGYLGVKVDPTPDEAYTVAGVTKGQPTPETDEKAAAKAQEASGLGSSTSDDAKK